MKLCKDCKNQNKKHQCQYYNSMSNYAERCKDFEILKSNEIDFVKMIEILHNASVTYSYAYEESVQIKKPSYIITQKDMVKLFNYIKSVN